MDDKIVMYHMLALIGDAYTEMKGEVVTSPSGGSFIPGQHINKFLMAVEDAFALYQEISQETVGEYHTRPRADPATLN